MGYFSELRQQRMFVFALIVGLTNFTGLGLSTGHAKPGNKVPLPIKKVDLKTTGALKKLGQVPSGVAKKTKPGKNSLSLKNELKALNDFQLSRGDQQTLNKALKAISQKKLALAHKYQAQLTHPASKKLVTWYELRSSKFKHNKQDLNQFLKDNPGWPNRSQIFTKIERSYLQNGVSPKATIAYFKQHKPRTKAGTMAYAQALISIGQSDKGVELIRKTYQNPKLSVWLEKHIISRHSEHLRTVDHEIRVDRLLYLDRRSKIGSALKTAKKLSKTDQQAAKFRASVIRNRRAEAKKLLAKLDKATVQTPGVYLSRVQLARRSKSKKKAQSLLINSSFKDDDVHGKDKWWNERRTNTRAAIDSGDYNTAYKIASNHENPSVNRYKEAEFLSGWIALRFLKKPELAETHFKNFKKAADGPRSLSKSTYWLGRAQKSLKKQTEAKQNFAQSATLFNTYYGQLAAHELDHKKAKITIPELPKVGAEIANNFVNRQEVQAIVIAHQADRASLVRLFFAHLRYHLQDPAELRLLAELAASLGYNQSTVRIGKTAMAQNLPLTHYAYPVRFMPKYALLRSEPENAIVYSIARQESEFNYNIKSRAGARGLLQVMPGTLKHIARKYRIKSQTSWLTQKPAFNAKVGSAYIGDRHDEFGGSYIMTFAGFNAGPGRVRQWVKKYGDPRSRHIDPIDWVERIPFTETRNYVQKVMANLQVYRARLSNGKSTIKSHQDLYRGKF